MEFHATDLTYNTPGGSAEHVVWLALKKAFSRQEGHAIWRFPIYAGKKEPDIVVFERDLGLLVIEVKGYSIKEIKCISGYSWRAISRDEAPSLQSLLAADAIKNRIERIPTLKGKFSVRRMVALPYVFEKAWIKKDLGGISDPREHILFKDHIGGNLLKKIASVAPLVTGSKMDEATFARLLRVAIGVHITSYSEADLITARRSSRFDVMQQCSAFVHKIDVEQALISMEVPPGYQQIRGIAGSGKTVTLAQKAAGMYFKYPQWKIAFVFSTRSLYEHVKSHIDRALRHESGGRLGLESAKERISVLHAWGAKDRPGFYRTIAEACGVDPQGFSDTVNDVSKACCNLLEKGKIPQLFDAVILDESQDLLSENKFEDKQAFFWLAHQVLRPVEDLPDERRLIWAYDEAQSLDNLSTPKVQRFLETHSLRHIS